MTNKRPLRKRRRDLPDEIMNYIEVNFYEGKEPTEIFNELMGVYPPKKWNKKFPNHLISEEKPKHTLRTIQRVCERLRVTAASATWGLQNEDFTPQETKVILKVLKCVVLRTGGRKCTITNNEAKWIARIGQAVPSLCQPGRLWLLWLLSQLYLLYESKEEPTLALDSYVAFEPWSDVHQWREYTSAVRQGLLPTVPLDAVLIGEGPYLDILDDEALGKFTRSILPTLERYQELKQRGYTDDEALGKLERERGPQ